MKVQYYKGQAFNKLVYSFSTQNQNKHFENKYYNKYKLQKNSPNDQASYVVHIDKESGIVASIERLDEQKAASIPLDLFIKKREQEIKEEQEFQRKNEKQKQDEDEEKLNEEYRQRKEENDRKNNEDFKKNEKENKKSSFINQEIIEGKFPDWYVTQAFIIALNVAIYLLWKISEMSEGVELKNFLDKYFTQFNTNKRNYKGQKEEIQHFPNIILSGFSHQQFAHLICNVGILLIFTRRIYEYLGPKGGYKFWALYLGALVGGYTLNNFNSSLKSGELQKDNMVRRMNIIYGQDLGFQNLRSDGGSDAISAMVAFTYCSLGSKNFIFPQFKYFMALMILPTYFLEDLSNYFYSKKDVNNSHINKPHPGGFLYGLIFYLANEAAKGTLKGFIDFKKVSVMGISLLAYTMFYWYLNEREYYGLRKVQNNLDKKHELTVEFPILYQKFRFTQRGNMENFDLKELEPLLENIKDKQVIHGDKIFLDIHKLIAKIPREEDRNFVCKELEKIKQLEFVRFKEAKLKRAKDYKIYHQQE